MIYKTIIKRVGIFCVMFLPVLSGFDSSTNMFTVADSQSTNFLTDHGYHQFSANDLVLSTAYTITNVKP